MSAKHGLAGALRKRGRILGCCMTLALALSGLVIAPAGASAEPSKNYLALGDSISFGYTQERFNNNFPNEAPAYFEEGFDHYLKLTLEKATQLGKGIADVNMACPGETSEGAIGENPALGGQASTEPPGGSEGIQGEGDWHPCAYRNVNGLPLHYALPGEHSQLEEALSILKEGAPAHPVRAITLNIGSNDELAVVARCKKEATEFWTKVAKGEAVPPGPYGGKSPEEEVSNCIVFKATHGSFAKIIENTGKIIGAIDSTSPGGGHYSSATVPGAPGPVVLMGFYNPDTFVLPGSDRLQRALNEEIETHLLPLFGGTVTYANPFNTVNKDSQKLESAITEGNKVNEEKFGKIEQEAICKYTEMCNPNVQEPGGKPAGKDGDIHPSIAGYKVLATLADKAWLANPVH